jgi:hypothetical protein
MVEPTFTEARGDVCASINYMKVMAQRPARYLCTPPPGMPELNWELESHPVRVFNGRPRLSSFSIETQGFTLRRAASAMTNFYDHEQVLIPIIQKSNGWYEKSLAPITSSPLTTMCGTGPKQNARKPARFPLRALCMAITLQSPHRNASATCSLLTRQSTRSRDGMPSLTCGDRSQAPCRMKRWPCSMRNPSPRVISSPPIYSTAIVPVRFRMSPLTLRFGGITFAIWNLTRSWCLQISILVTLWLFPIPPFTIPRQQRMRPHGRVSKCARLLLSES